MPHSYSFFTRHLAAGALLLALAGLLATPAAAQRGPKPTWAAATAGASNSIALPSQVRATATDANGNVVVVGSFTGTFTLGSTTLTSAGGADIFVAKYLPATNAWAWMVRAGGAGNDLAAAVAVRGTSIYLTGYVNNSSSNSLGVAFGTLPQYGASTTTSFDAFLAKVTDAGTSAAFVWSQVMGGSNADFGNGVAASSLDASVYVTGSQFNDAADTNAVRYGGSGTVAGMTAQPGVPTGTASDDLFLAKYTDNGTSATLGWTQVAGGNAGDYGYGVAVSGISVYVASTLYNSRTNASGVAFGYAGTGPATAVQYGAAVAASPDAVLAKYQDQGQSATFVWSQVGGGGGVDYGQAVAVSGTSVYLTGYLTNDQADTNLVRFGGGGSATGAVIQPGATSTSSADVFLAKYADQGSTATLNWTQVGGGTGADRGTAIAVAGNRVYLGGYLSNNTANDSGVLFGGSNSVNPGTASQAGATATNNYDVLAVGYMDNGATATLAWTQVGGGTGVDQGQGVAVAGTRLYVGGFVVPAATFGPLAISTPTGATVALLGALDLAATLAVVPALVATPALYPNPAAGPATLSGAAPATAGQVVNALGREVATFRTDAGGAAALPAGLAPGVYLVRVGAAVGRWVVQ